jgi:hypothetical protein
MIKSLYNKVRFYFLKRKAENAASVTYDRFGNKIVRYFYTEIKGLSLILNDELDDDTIKFFMSLDIFTFNAIFGKAKIETIQNINQNNRSVLDEIGEAVGNSLEINGFVSTSTSQ